MHSTTPESFSIAAPDMALGRALQEKIDGKTKPPGSLGGLETLALRLGLIQNSLSPQVRRPRLLVFAADHGAARSGVSAYPQDVTWQMVENFLAGGAAINVFARQFGWDLGIVDAGVAHDFAGAAGARAGLIDAKIGYGTRNFIDEAAMRGDEVARAIARGAALARDAAAAGSTVLACGEMGIGNTASAALLTHCLTGAALDSCVGRGTGLDDSGLARKKALLAQAVRRYRAAGGRLGSEAPALGVLAEFGGFEIAMMVGAMLAAAEARMLILVDGFIVTAALMIAQRLHPEVLDYCIFAHRSGEAGHTLQLATLGVSPLLELGLRLGEGTGAALALPLVQAAANFLDQMASFASAGVAERA